jgi:tRNA dimethylallyltransferase
MQTSSKKLIAVLGPTSSGKSDYAIRLAREVDGEIISVDSRQVYRGMDVGTGKVTRDPTPCHPGLDPGSSCFSGNEKLQIPNTEQTPVCHPELVEGSSSTTADSSTRRLARNDKHFYSEGIRHHLLDVASPKREYNITHFLRDAKKAVADIEKRGKVPILCGGTTFWIEALLLGTTFPEVKPDKKLRARLSKLSAEALFGMLQEKDPERAATIDTNNKIRLIRALEIIASLGKVPPLCHPGLDPGSRKKDLDSRFRGNDKLKVIVLNPPKEILHARIERRLKERLEQGMIDEVKRLHDEGVSWKRLEGFGLEYRWCARLLQEKIPREEMGIELLKESRHYAKRQLTFLRRLERNGLKIEWKEN